MSTSANHGLSCRLLEHLKSLALLASAAASARRTRHARRQNKIDYRLTVSDPQTFSQAWTLTNSVWRTDEEIYEAGCHERNIGLAAILAGARAQEKK